MRTYSTGERALFTNSMVLRSQSMSFSAFSLEPAARMWCMTSSFKIQGMELTGLWRKGCTCLGTH